MKNSQKYMTAPENRQFFAFPDFCGGGGYLAYSELLQRDEASGF